MLRLPALRRLREAGWKKSATAARSSTSSSRACRCSIAHGRVTIWNDALERMLGCPRERALGRAARRRRAGAGAHRAAARDQGHAVGRQAANAGAHQAAGAGRRRAFSQVKVLPVAGGVDAAVARRHRADAAPSTSSSARRAAGAGGGRRQRRAVAVEPADAGVLRLGPLARDDRTAAARRASGRPEEWLDRVHADDIAGAQGDAEGAPRRADRRVPARAPHPPRGRHLPAVPVPRPGGQRRPRAGATASPAR